MAKIWGKTDWKAQRVLKKGMYIFQPTNLKVAELHNYYSVAWLLNPGGGGLYTSLCISLYENRQYTYKHIHSHFFKKIKQHVPMAK